MIRILLLTLIYIALAKPAYAYIDAAIGSLVLQGLAAGFFTFMVAWRAWTDKIKGFFNKRTGEDPAEEDQQADPVE